MHLIVLLDRTELFDWRGSGDLLLIGGRGDGDDVGERVKVAYWSLVGGWCTKDTTSNPKKE